MRKEIMRWIAWWFRETWRKRPWRIRKIYSARVDEGRITYVDAYNQRVPKWMCWSQGVGKGRRK
jgi:hypothetical protein